MLCILHGYLLEGSGSNLWTRAIVQSLCRQGETVHLVCQENHPERYDFVAEARLHHADGGVEVVHRAETPYPGRCVLHRPELGDTLPVYVWDEYEEFDRVVPMIELADAEIEAYVGRNASVVERIVREERVTAMHANHAALMPVVAQRVQVATGVPFAVMPHGSAIEYAVKKDERFHRYASDAVSAAGRVFVIGEEMSQRVRSVFADVPGVESKLSELHLGVDTSLFRPIARESRRANVERLLESLEGTPRGRTAEQTARLRDGLEGEVSPPPLQERLAAAADYDGKRPDADLEGKLRAVDWEGESILLFVGRLISAKGLHSVLAALPLVLERRPDLRLIAVGHGPLREPMEAFLRALETGDRTLAEEIVARGRTLEGIASHDGEMLPEVQHFFDDLETRGDLDSYWGAAQRHLRADRVVFTGYLEHAQLRFLFPCCDVAVFPSVIREAGPLVFLEAMASGCLPLGTDFGGMAASIDSAAKVLPPEEARLMRLSADPERTTADIAAHVPPALEAAPRVREALARLAREQYDWASVSRKLVAELQGLERASG